MNNINRIGTKIHKEHEYILYFCSQYKRIHLYGMGVVANRVYEYLREEEIVIKDVIVGDGHKNCDKFLDQYDVFEISNINVDENDGIILGVRRELQNEVKKDLKAKGVKDSQIYDYGIYKGSFPEIMKKSCIKNFPHAGGYFSNYSELDELGIVTGTDKSSKYHNYLNKYEFYLNRWKDADFVLLELGVFKGASLKMWGDYFKKATIYGVDIQLECKKYEQENCKVIIGDLGNEEVLEKIGELKPTIIVDDASHLWSHQIKAIYHLLPKLQSGGVFIMEDLETSFSSYSYMNYDDATVSGYDFCSALAEVVSSREFLRYDRLDARLIPVKKEIEYLAMQIELISFIHGSCIIVKK